MSEHVIYQGKSLGRLKFNEHLKVVFVAENLDSLETLLGLKASDEVELESSSKMPYETFKEKHLKDVSAFYPTMDAFLLKNYKAKTIEEYEQSQK